MEKGKKRVDSVHWMFVKGRWRSFTIGKREREEEKRRSKEDGMEQRVKLIE